MFRLVAARSTRRYAGRLCRFNSTGNTTSQSTPELTPKASTEPSPAEATLTSKAKVPSSTPEPTPNAETPAGVKPAASEPTTPEPTSETKSETTATDIAPEATPETEVTEPRTRGRRLKGARQSTSTEVEAKSDEWKKLGLKYDPDTLPIEQHLDPAVREYDEEEWSRTLIHGRGLAPAFQHQRTHDVPVANIHFRSHQIPIMNLFIHFASHAAASLGIPVSKTVSLPTQRRLWTVLRSPFAHKKSQENFERKVHKRALKAWDAHPDVVQRWVDYLRKHAMPGVGMRVTTWQRVPLGIGASALARDKVSAKDAAVRPTGLANKQIEELAQKIIAEERASPSSEVAASVSSPKSKA